MAMHWFQGQRIEYRILRVPCFCVKRAGSFCIVVTFTFLVRLDYAEQESTPVDRPGDGTGAPVSSPIRVAVDAHAMNCLEGTCPIRYPAN